MYPIGISTSLLGYTVLSNIVCACVTKAMPVDACCHGNTIMPSRRSTI